MSIPVKMTKDLSKCSTSELKAILKENGMVQSGDKLTMIFRLNLLNRCKNRNLQSSTGENPCQMKLVDLKKQASALGVSPIGSQDEILEAYIKALENLPKLSSTTTSLSTAVESSSSNLNDDPGGNNNAIIDPVLIAEKIVELGENSQYEDILNIAALPGQRITRQSPLPMMRKAYLKLSLVIHPDKIGRIYPHATKAFQELVKAFDNLSSVNIDVSGDGSTSSTRGQKEKTFTISRSNDGCYRTRVCCPRCKQPWSEGGLDGNPPYFYNFLMQGLKCYTCSTCLCEFGCMTAIHRCPHCNRSFEYSIEDYHRKIQCPNLKCGKMFGFYLFSISDRMMKELRTEIKAEQDRRIKAREATQRRKGRAIAKLSTSESERAFVLGLADCCPRCGRDFEGYPDEETQREHLRDCTDTITHESHKQNQAKNAANQAEKVMKQSKQEAAQTQAAWTFLGSNTSQLWLLDDEQIRKKAIEVGVKPTGDRDEVISRIAGYGDLTGHEVGISTCGQSTIDNCAEIPSDGTFSTSITDYHPQDKMVKSSKRKRMTVDSVPSNYQQLSLSQLRSVCAANGLLGLIKPNATRVDVLELIEDSLCSDD